MTQDPGPKVALRATLYDADGRDREVELRPGIVDGLGERQLLWIDLDGRDEEGIARLVEIFDLPGEVAKVLASDRAVAQLLRYPDRVTCAWWRCSRLTATIHRPTVWQLLSRPRSTSSSPRTWSSPAIAGC